MTFRILRSKLRAALCVIASIFALASAQADTVICDNCDQATMQTEAIALGVGTQYVVDVANNVVRKFDVSGRCRKDRETGLQECIGTSAIERAVEQEIIDYFTTVHLLSKTVISIPANVSGNNVSSAYNALSTPAGRAAVQNFVNNSPQARSLQRVAPLSPGIPPQTLTVQFWDSSTASYVFNGDFTGQWNLQPNSALDAAGNPVVFGIRDFVSEDGSGRSFDFGYSSPDTSTGPFSDFLEVARRSGVQITGAPSARLRLMCIYISGQRISCFYI
jgi:hypothetical protein